MPETLQQLLRERLTQDTPAVKYGERVWTWREHLADATATAAALISTADPDRPLHVGALLGNTPEMLTAMASAALGGYVLCGINDTRRGEALARDIVRADCQILLTDPTRRELLDGLDLPGVQVFDVSARVLVGSARRRCNAGPVSRGHAHRHVHDDLHLRDQRRA